MRKAGVTVIDIHPRGKGSQKPILVGSGRTIGRRHKARIGIEEFIGSKVFPSSGQVRKDWRERTLFLRRPGLLR